jgi:hypothetical protein
MQHVCLDRWLYMRCEGEEPRQQRAIIKNLLERNYIKHQIFHLVQLDNYSITEKQFERLN